MGRKTQQDENVNKMFERQQRSLNRKRFLQSLIGIAVLVAAYLALQLTPYRDIPGEIISGATDFVKDIFSSGPAEPDPRYW